MGRNAKKGCDRATNEQIQYLCSAFLNAVYQVRPYEGYLLGCTHRGQDLDGMKFMLRQGVHCYLPQQQDRDNVALSALKQTGLTLGQIRQPLKKAGLKSFLTILGHAVHNSGSELSLKP